MDPKPIRGRPRHKHASDDAMRMRANKIAAETGESAIVVLERMKKFEGVPELLSGLDLTFLIGGE